MKIAVLFDGAGLARKGLEDAGHDCIGFEIDPMSVYLGSFVGKGMCSLCDVRDLSERIFDGFDAVWPSPPCQGHSIAKSKGTKTSKHGSFDLLGHSIDLMKKLKNKGKIFWIENVVGANFKDCNYKVFNCGEFGDLRQSRNRKIGGFFLSPKSDRQYQKSYENVPPAITATEFKGSWSDKRRASRFFLRKMTLEEVAYHQHFEIPDGWENPPAWFYDLDRDYLLKNFEASTHDKAFENAKYKAIGNGVPCSTSKAFGMVYDLNGKAIPDRVNYERSCLF
jgi:site-specific DNA-cytosine methylase